MPEPASAGQADASRSPEGSNAATWRQTMASKCTETWTGGLGDERCSGGSRGIVARSLEDAAGGQGS